MRDLFSDESNSSAFPVFVERREEERSAVGASYAIRVNERARPVAAKFAQSGRTLFGLNALIISVICYLFKK